MRCMIRIIYTHAVFFMLFCCHTRSTVQQQYNSTSSSSRVLSNHRPCPTPPPPGLVQMAQYVHERFISFGIPDVDIQPVDALISSPVGSSLELLDADSGEVVFTAALSEDVVDIDATSDTWYRNHTFNGWVRTGFYLYGRMFWGGEREAYPTYSMMAQLSVGPSTMCPAWGD